MNDVTKHEICIHFKNYTKIVIEVQREFEWGVYYISLCVITLPPQKIITSLKFFGRLGCVYFYSVLIPLKNYNVPLVVEWGWVMHTT